MSSESNTPYRENGSALYNRIAELEKELAKHTMKPKYEYSLSDDVKDNLAGTIVVFMIVSTLAILVAGIGIAIEVPMWVGMRRFLIFESFALVTALLWAGVFVLIGLKRERIGPPFLTEEASNE